MKRILIAAILCVMLINPASAEDWQVWTLVDESGASLTQICYEPSEGDEYLGTDNHLYRIIRVEGNQAIATDTGEQALPAADWADEAMPVSALTRAIGIYCTHSDESYQPSDGHYSTTERGSIYQVAQRLADSLEDEGISAQVSDMLHHPHDAGAYRRSRQTAVELLRTISPDCLIDVHRDGIPDPTSYETEIGGMKASKIRLLVGRGNQNAELNKEFALAIKAVADRVYPGLIKDIYMGKGAFNQDLQRRSILFECGTYTLEKELVLASMPMMADVLSRVLYGGLVGSVGRSTSDMKNSEERGGITQGEPDPTVEGSAKAYAGGTGFLVAILLIGTAGIALLSAGSLKRGGHKFSRNMNEMTGGLIGKKPEDNEDPHHS